MRTKKLNYLTPEINTRLQEVGDQTSGLVKDMKTAKQNISGLSSVTKQVSVKAINGKNWLVFEDYTPVTPVVPTPVVPTITLDTTAKTVALSATSGLSIKYTTEATGTPSTAYTQSIDVSNGATIKAITTNSDGESSTVPSITITFQETDNGGTLAFPTGSTYTKNGGASTQYSTPIETAEGEVYVVTSAGSTATINITA